MAFQGLNRALRKDQNVPAAHAGPSAALALQRMFACRCCASWLAALFVYPRECPPPHTYTGSTCCGPSWSTCAPCRAGWGWWRCRRATRCGEACPAGLPAAGRTAALAHAHCRRVVCRLVPPTTCSQAVHQVSTLLADPAQHGFVQAKTGSLQPYNARSPPPLAGPTPSSPCFGTCPMLA